MVASVYTPPYERPAPNLTPEQKQLIARRTLEFKESLHKSVGRYSEQVHDLVVKTLKLY